MSTKGSPRTPKSVKTPRTLEQERQQDQLLEQERERILHAAARKIQKIYKNTKEFRKSRKEHQKKQSASSGSTKASAAELAEEDGDLSPDTYQPPQLMRNISSTIPDQGKTLTCWNHTVAKVCTRLIFNVLAIQYEDSTKCDELYDYKDWPIDDPEIIRFAMVECETEKNGYLKFLFTAFFTRFLQNHFGCNRQFPSDIFKYVEEHLFAVDVRRDIQSNQVVLAFLDDKPSGRSIKEECEKRVFPILTRFYHFIGDAPMMYRNIVLKDIARAGNGIEQIENMLKMVLQNGLYVSLLFYLGKGGNSFTRKFETYKKGGRKPVETREVDIVNGHVMTIVGYSIIKEPGQDGNGHAVIKERLLYHIKNTWGKAWGEDGMISYFIEELLPLQAIFDVVTFKDKSSNVSLLNPVPSPVEIPLEVANGMLDEELRRSITTVNEQVKGSTVNELMNNMLLLIKRGAKPYTCDDVRLTALHVACKVDIPTVDRMRIIKKLLKYGVDVNIPDDMDRTPLAFACERGDLDTIAILLSKGANVNKSDKFGNHPLMYALSGFFSKPHLEEGEVSEHDPRKKEDTYTSAIMYLLTHGADPNLYSKLPILYYAAKQGHPGMVSLLVNHGADPYKSYYSSDFMSNQSPLDIAKRSGHDEVAAILESKMEDLRNYRYPSGHTPLLYASSSGNKEMVRFLLARKVDPNQVTNRGMSSLFFTVNIERMDNDDIDIATMLLVAGAQVDLAIKDGTTPLSHAVQNENAKMALFLLDNGADPTRPNNTGKTPITYAKQLGIAHISALLEKDTELTRKTKEEEAISIATEKLKRAIKGRRTRDFIRLIDEGAPIDTNVDGLTVLEAAIKAGEVELVGELERRMQTVQESLSKKEGELVSEGVAAISSFAEMFDQAKEEEKESTIPGHARRSLTSPSMSTRSSLSSQSTRSLRRNMTRKIKKSRKIHVKRIKTKKYRKRLKNKRKTAKR